MMHLIRNLFLFTILSAGSLRVAGQSPAMKKLQPLLNQQGMAEYFSGIFHNLGIRIPATQEAFSVSHKGTYFELSEGINEQQVDFIVDLETENIARLVKHSEDGKISDEESFQIIRVLFSPMTRASLNNPFLQKKKYLRAGGVEELIHVTLLDPANKSHYQHTIVYSTGQWLIFPGLQGNAPRIFSLTPSQAITYQRRLFEAKQQNTTKAWKQFARWYRTWKKEVSVTP